MHISLRACVKCPLVHVLGWIAAAAPAALKAFWQEAPRNTTITIDNRSSCFSSIFTLFAHSLLNLIPSLCNLAFSWCTGIYLTILESFESRSLKVVVLI